MIGIRVEAVVPCVAGYRNQIPCFELESLLLLSQRLKQHVPSARNDILDRLARSSMFNVVFPRRNFINMHSKHMQAFSRQIEIGFHIPYFVLALAKNLRFVDAFKQCPMQRGDLAKVFERLFTCFII